MPELSHNDYNYYSIYYYWKPNGQGGPLLQGKINCSTRSNQRRRGGWPVWCFLQRGANFKLRHSY